MFDKFKICISIAVHERPDVIVDQINNFRYFYDNNVAIVLHVSKQFRDIRINLACRDTVFYLKDDVFINPLSYKTNRKKDLVQIHNANYEYARKLFDFDYYVIHSSNDMYVRKGVVNYISKKQNGLHQTPLSPEMEWLPGRLSFGDRMLKNMMDYTGLRERYGTQAEGLFFQKEVFGEMKKVIDKFYEELAIDGYYREEMYYSTLLKKFVGSIGTPFVYSEVVGGRRKIDRDLIMSLAQGNYHEDEYSNNGIGAYRCYDFDNIYAVKRIARKYNDANRRCIRKLMTV
jgi:hypothetical protein